jgi:hypothetical protein
MKVLDYWESRDRRWLGGLLVPLLLACGSTPEPAKELKTIASWTETARMVVDARLARTVTRTYTETALAAVTEELAKEAEHCRSLPAGDGSRERILAILHDLGATVERLRTLNGAGDDAGLFHERDQLASEQGLPAEVAHTESSRQ